MRDLLVRFEVSFWPQISAIVFGSLFVCLAIWVLLPGRGAEYRKAERLPLED